MSQIQESMRQIHNQLVASHEQIDLDEAQERVQRILHGQAGPTLTPQPEKPQRKRRSDAGVPKGPKVIVHDDDIVLRLDLEVALSVAQALAEPFPSMSGVVYQQIARQLQKKIDALQKQK